jgi:nitrogen PTS system EIIA component
LSAAIERGGVLYRIGGHTPSAVLLEIANLLKLPPKVNRNQFYQALEMRERLGSTAIGNGFAIPHSRQALIPELSASSITICFLERPIAYGALDGQPVHTLFTLISHNLRDHVGLLSRLVFALRDEALKKALKNQASREELFGHFHRIENGLLAVKPE